MGSTQCQVVEGDNGREGLGGLQHCICFSTPPPRPPPHPRPAQVSPRPSADPGGAWATVFVCLSFSCLLCQRVASPVYVHIPLPSSHSFPHNQTLRPQRSRDSFLASCDVEYCVWKSRKPTFPKLRYVPVCSRVPQTPSHFLKH